MSFRIVTVAGLHVRRTGTRANTIAEDRRPTFHLGAQAKRAIRRAHEG